MLEVAERTDGERAQEIRRRLRNPPNAKSDTGMTLGHPHGVTGWEKEKIKREILAKERAESRAGKQEKLLKQLAIIASTPLPPVRDWLDIGTKKHGTPPNFYTQIIKTVAHKFNISIKDLLSHYRNTCFVVPRQVAMYLAHDLMRISYPQIGRKIGNRDHTTALHAVRRISEKMLKDDDLCLAIVEIRAELEIEITRWREE